MKYEKCKVVMLSTEKASSIGLYGKILTFNEGGNTYRKGNDTICIKQHVYILSNEEIKEGDWFLYNNEYIKFEGWDSIDSMWIEAVKKGKKIIATTNPELYYITIPTEISGQVKQPLPKPTDEFIKIYCELGGIDEILVEYEKSKNICNCYYTKHCQSTNLPIGIYCRDYNEIHVPYILKVAQDNTITIKSIKDSWNREETINCCETALLAGFANGSLTCEKFKIVMKEWIKENLQCYK